MSDYTNLDQKAAEYAQEMVKQARTKKVKDPIGTLERLVTKTLGVLQEQGVYAALLFLYSRTSDENDMAPAIYNPLFRLLRDEDKNPPHEIPAFKSDPVPANNADAQTTLAFYNKHVCNDLHKLLLVKDIYEQTLIYARYGAKAANKESA